MINVNRQIWATDLRNQLQSVGVSTTITNKFIRFLDRAIIAISQARVTPDQIREENRRRILNHINRKHRHE
jgi:hypothetical protein